MIFITLGSQKFQFDRLLKAVDVLMASNEIHEEVFAQVGYSNYVPKQYPSQKFLNRVEFSERLETADVVITHGGTGAIVGALKSGARVIAVPRRAKYGEHVDDHQLQMVGQFKDLNLICECDDCDDLVQALKFVREHEFQKYVSNSNAIVNSINQFIRSVR